MTETDGGQAYTEHRSLLFTVAYEMLGSAADSEDVLQEVWLRWSAADRDDVRDPRAYLVRITTRLALNRLRTLARQRETYVGPWLPEPLLTSPDVADDVELAESVSTAMLLVMETLNPTERAVFVLREVFGFDYDEIAESVEKSPENVRQIAHRARQHVAARRPHTQVTKAEQERVFGTFTLAAATGDMQSLMDVLAPDVVLITDGGGHKKAALRPIEGRDKVLRFLMGITQGGTLTADQVGLINVNGAPALEVYLDGALDLVITLSIADGVVQECYFVRNPEKLGRLGEATSLRR